MGPYGLSPEIDGADGAERGAGPCGRVVCRRRVFLWAAPPSVVSRRRPPPPPPSRGGGGSQQAPGAGGELLLSSSWGVEGHPEATRGERALASALVAAAADPVNATNEKSRIASNNRTRW